LNGRMVDWGNQEALGVSVRSVGHVEDLRRRRVDRPKWILRCRTGVKSQSSGMRLRCSDPSDAMHHTAMLTNRKIDSLKSHQDRAAEWSAAGHYTGL
jgi:hypothetical protein